MDEAVQKTFDDLAAGATDIDISKIQRKLLYGCFERGSDPDVEVRMGALRVAAHLPPEDRVRVADPLIRDTVEEVRRYALAIATSARQHGLEILRTAVDGADPELAVDALGLIVRHLDRGSSMHARGWLHHADPRVRAGAAMLLGAVSGPAMAVHLGRLAETDPIAAVRAIAAEGVRQVTGDSPKPEGTPYWESQPVDLRIDLTPYAPELPRPTENLATIYPEEDEPSAEVPAELVPVAEPGTEEVRDTPRDWRDPAPLPAALPSEPKAVLKLLGWVSEADRSRVWAHFQTLSDHAAAMREWRPGSDPGLGRGVALAIKASEMKTQASMLRVMLRQEDAGVRAGAAEAIGRTGALSMVPQLAVLLDDADPDVKVAAVRGMAELLVRMERFVMLRDRLQPLANDPDPGVKAAVKAALESAQ